jgi:hypothetical protein
MLSVLQSFVDLQNFRELLLVDALRFVYCTSQLPSISGQCRWRMRTTTSSKSFTHYLDDIIRFHVSSKGPLPKALRNLAPNIGTVTVNEQIFCSFQKIPLEFSSAWRSAED